MKLPLVLLLAMVSAGTLRAQWPPLDSENGDVEKQALDLLAAGRQDDAEKALLAYGKTHRHDQRATFLLACCLQSRFDPGADDCLAAVAGLNPQTHTGQCANILIQLNQKEQVDANLNALEKLVRTHPDDLMLHWMLAVESGANDRPQEGADQFEEILKHWNPGPVLVHQTYGNVLDDLHRLPEALSQKQKAVELDPTSWSYQALAATLAKLQRYADANTAYQKMGTFPKADSEDWETWALVLSKLGKYEDCIEKANEAVQLDPNNAQAVIHWADALSALNRPALALIKYDRAAMLDPHDTYVQSRIQAAKALLAAPAVKGPDHPTPAE